MNDNIINLYSPDGSGASTADLFALSGTLQTSIYNTSGTLVTLIANTSGTLDTAIYNASGLFLRQDGTTPLTGDWNAGGYNITNSGNLSVRDYIRVGNITDDVAKECNVLGQNFDSGTETEGFSMIHGWNAASNANLLDIGGGSASYNAVSYVTFYTAANASTRIGTARGRFDANGLLDVYYGLNVQGEVTASGLTCPQYNSDLNTFSGHVGVGSTALTNASLLVKNISVVQGSENFYGIYNYHDRGSGTGTYANDILNHYNFLNLSQVNGEYGTVYGIYNETQLAAGTVGRVGFNQNFYGQYTLMDMNGGTVCGVTMGTYINMDIEPAVFCSGQILALQARVGPDGDVLGNVTGIRGTVDQAAGKTITGDAYAIHADMDIDGTVTGNTVMVYIEEHSNVDYAIYHTGTAPSVLGGDISVSGSLQLGIYTIERTFSVALSDSVAATICTITTPDNPSYDGGGYSVFIDGQVFHGGNSSATNAAKWFQVKYSHINDTTGNTGDSTPEISYSATSAADASATRDIGVISFAAGAAGGNYVRTMDITADFTGTTITTGRVVAHVKVVYYGYSTITVT
ncbi:MAG TPA: hypothetical protein VI911_11065 [Patescibacteria group bacterium]|nr:hypothetical protein [Patescibacteria group bacterium]